LRYATTCWAWNRRPSETDRKEVKKVMAPKKKAAKKKTTAKKSAKKK
jgi:hypothetical protein